MKPSSLLFLGFTGVLGPSLVRGSDVHELENHIIQLKAEAHVLSTANVAKDAEIASLHAKLDELDAGCGGDDGGWTPTVGDSWNYNLATPIKTSVDVDVFLIDMGERRFLLTSCLKRRAKRKTRNASRYVMFMIPSRFTWICIYTSEYACCGCTHVQESTQLQ